MVLNCTGRLPVEGLQPLGSYDVSMAARVIGRMTIRNGKWLNVMKREESSRGW